MKLQVRDRSSIFLFVLQALILLYGSLQMLKGEFDGDFWEHAAIVDQFARTGVERHPMYHTDDPHAFYSPYLFPS